MRTVRRAGRRGHVQTDAGDCVGRRLGVDRAIGLHLVVVRDEAHAFEAGHFDAQIPRMRRHIDELQRVVVAHRSIGQTHEGRATVADDVEIERRAGDQAVEHDRADDQHQPAVQDSAGPDQMDARLLAALALLDIDARVAGKSPVFGRV